MTENETFVSTGIEGLDQVLGGGAPREQISLIRGASGAGKTTLCMQFLIAGARQGETVLYLGTSENEEEIRKLARSHDWSLDGVLLHRLAPPDAGVQQTMLHPAEVELPQTMEALLSDVQKVSPTRLVIDSLAEIRVQARDELWYRRQLMILKQHFTGKRCTVLVVEIPGPAQPAIDSVVSGVIELERNTPTYGPDRRRLRVAKVRSQPFYSGYHDYKINTGGIQVFPRLTAADYRRQFAVEQISTGLSQMDRMLDGGLVRGTSILLLGLSGTGKSALASQLVVASAQRDERSVLYVFDERVQTLFQRAEGIGLPLAQHVDSGVIRVQQIDPAELTSGEFTHTVREQVEGEGVRMVAIDSLNGYAYAMPEERLLSLHLHELTSYLNQQEVTAVFTMTQHGVFNSTQQPFDVSYIADTVVLFRHFEFDGRIRKAISVYKCRSGWHETAIRELQIGSEGLQLGKPLRQFQGVLAGAPRFLGDRLVGLDQDKSDAD